MSSLPDFAKPPVTEVALGVQFKALPQLRAVELAALREQWRTAYPVAQEQPPLPPMRERRAIGPPIVQLQLGPPLLSRLWFLSLDASRLVQLQSDRLIVNWRQTADGEPYPRYPAMRSMFEDRAGDVSAFTTERGFGDLNITQVEVNYINSIPFEADRLGHLEDLLRGISVNPSHHLEPPEQSRVAMVYSVPDIGSAPVRLHVSVAPAPNLAGTPAVRFSLSVRGAPAGGTVEDGLEFMDGAHAHIVRSFDEMTVEAMHTLWEKRQ